MTPLTWLAAASGLVVMSLPSPAQLRADDLGGAGRLDRVGRVTLRSRRAAGAVMPLVVSLSAAIVGAVLWRGGIALASATGVVLATAALLGRDRVTGRRDIRRRRELLTAVRVLAGELAAGARPADALSAAAATSETAGEVFGAAARTQRDGDDPVDELAASPEPAARALAVAWRLTATTGAALAAAVERVAVDLGEIEDRRRAVAVALAGPRSSAVLLSGLPVIGVALGAGMGAAPLQFLLSDPAGRAVCCGGVVLDAAGILWIRRIVRRAAR